MLTSGQLARCHGLSTKTLRHYDSIGLFRPALTGRDNGYRYYLPAQVAELGRIVMLRELGLPLDEIAKLLPAAGMEAVEGIEFEYMDARFLAPDHPDSLTELYIPIR
ncbi:MerR family transcriptional regulator [Chromobacterium violaceum]|uniref:MerR family transcriptional regulator n=1 Tax=Chromobacterium violaceum TaxID=536 RepID=UPI001B33079A|nr:MerR family transcriptional regulator [Chromobacterium violaceum]MBP4046999.1 MerR family transcriptional regulator [Chromobacterium violaceum]